MRTSRHVLSICVLSFAVLLLGAAPLLAKCGHLKLKVAPKEAYVFVDGIPLGPGAGVIWAQPGEHTLAVYNYGYKPYNSKFTAESGKTTSLTVTLEAIPGTVPGPFGWLQIKGPKGNAVLLNGTTPDYFVGNLSEFKHGQLLVPPGDYQVTVLGCCSGTSYSGQVSVAEGQRTVLPIANAGAKQQVDWSQGKGLGPQPRYTPEKEVAVIKPTAQITVDNSQIACGGSSQLKWSSTDAPKVELSGAGAVAASGEQSVSPKQTTGYKLTATGPGGVVSADANVNVNTAIQSTLSVEPAEVRYETLNGQVTQQGSATITWSAPNAGTVTLDPFGTVQNSGSRTVQPTPHKTDEGPIDETINYTLHSSNDCGGSDTKTASLHLVGENKRTHEISLGRSVYFPTDLPTKRHPDRGLVSSEEDVLRQLADGMKKYFQDLPSAHLVLEGYADRRGSARYNMSLTGRRADRVKSFLVEQGVPAGNLETKALGKSQQMDRATVKQLEDQIPNLSDQDKKKINRRIYVFTLANNRRVDIVSPTTGKRSEQFFPYNAPDVKQLLREPVRRSAAPKAEEKTEPKKTQ